MSRVSFSKEYLRMCAEYVQNLPCVHCSTPHVPSVLPLELGSVVEISPPSITVESLTLALVNTEGKYDSKQEQAEAILKMLNRSEQI